MFNTNQLTNYFQSLIPEDYQLWTSEHPVKSYYLQGLIFSFLIYLLYLELSPKLGGIFFRPDATGNTRFRLGGVMPMLLYPFQSIDFWYPCNWDLNFIMFSNLGAAIFTALKYQQAVLEVN